MKAKDRDNDLTKLKIDLRINSRENFKKLLAKVCISNLKNKKNKENC